jgi:hypothetical protein
LLKKLIGLIRRLLYRLTIITKEGRRCIIPWSRSLGLIEGDSLGFGEF